jgi:putative peptidoglycan lipid II flippase
VVTGAILQTLILSPGLHGEGFHVGILLDLTSQRLREVARLLVPNGLSVGVNYAGFIVDTSYATRAVDPAGLAAIYNAFLLVGLPIALLGQAIGQAAFPRLAAQAEAGNWTEMRRMLARSLGAAVGLALPAVGALLLLGRPTIRILFEHGEFTAAAGNLTFRVLVAYAIALPAYIATEVITRGLVSLRDTRTPLVTNTGQLVLRIVLISLLLDSIGVVAIPAAFAISSTMETLILGTVLFRKLRSKSQQTATTIALER